MRHQLADGLVGHRDVVRIARERDPAERPAPDAEQRADVGRDEAGEVERLLAARLLGVGADVVAVVEDLGAGALHREHRLDLGAHALLRPRDVAVRIARAERRRVGERQVARDVTIQRIVGGGLLGHEVGDEPAANELGIRLRGVRAHADGDRLARLGRRDRALHRRRRDRRCARRRTWCRGASRCASGSTSTARHDMPAIVAASGCAPPMPPSPAVSTHFAGFPGARFVGRARGDEGLVGALQDALRADVDPRAGGHLPVHREAELLEPAELVPGRPLAARGWSSR